jgi:hypothetical protein
MKYIFQHYVYLILNHIQGHDHYGITQTAGRIELLDFTI